MPVNLVIILHCTPPPCVIIDPNVLVTVSMLIIKFHWL